MGGGHLVVSLNGSECLDEKMINVNICLILDIVDLCYIIMMILPALL